MIQLHFHPYSCIAYQHISGIPAAEVLLHGQQDLRDDQGCSADRDFVCVPALLHSPLVAHDANPHGAGKCEKQVGEEPTLPIFHGRYIADMLLVHVLDSNLTTRVFSVGMEHDNMMFFFFWIRSLGETPHSDLRILLSRLHVHCESVLFLCEALHRLLFELHPLSRAHHP